MTERVVSSVWWLIVTALIVASAGACVLLCYQAVLNLVAHRWTPGVALTAGGVMLGVTSLLFCWYRTDLLA